MMVAAIVSVFAGDSADTVSRVLQLSLIFLAMAVLGMGTWAAVDADSTRLLQSPLHTRCLNQLLALLLLASTWLAMA